MAALNKFNCFTKDLAEGVHQLKSSAGHQLVVALSNGSNLPSASADSVLGDITTISYTNLSSRNLTINASTGQSGGVFKLLIDDLVLTASGTVAAFRYVIIYNDTPSSPLDPLIGWYDYGSEITLLNGETFTIDFDGTNGFLTIT